MNKEIFIEYPCDYCGEFLIIEVKKIKYILRNKSGRVWCGKCDVLYGDRVGKEKKYKQKQDNKKRNNEIIDLYKSGKSSTSIAKIYKITYQQVWNIIHKFPSSEWKDIVEKNKKTRANNLPVIIKHKEFIQNYPIKQCIICKNDIEKMESEGLYKKRIVHTGLCTKAYHEIKKEIRHQEKRKKLTRDIAEWIKNNKRIPYSKITDHKVENGELGNLNYYFRYTNGFKKAKDLALTRIAMNRISELKE